jgi:hypothetical protein
VDFGLGLLDDFDERIFMRELGRTGVAGVSGSVSGPVLLRLKDKLRLMPASATALMDRSGMADAGPLSSSTGEKEGVSNLFRVNSPLSPPLDCLRSTIFGSCILGSCIRGCSILDCLKGTRLCTSSSADLPTSGGLARRLVVKLD